MLYYRSIVVVPRLRADSRSVVVGGNEILYFFLGESTQTKCGPTQLLV